MSAPADKFQFTCPLRSTTLWSVALAYDRHVSIHVPLAEHDRNPPDLMLFLCQFQFTCPSRSTTYGTAANGFRIQVSIHVPLAEHDFHTFHSASISHTFQFTCPSRSTTAWRFYDCRQGFCFNSRAPRGARLNLLTDYLDTCEFQFTCPSRSTTRRACEIDGVRYVSIHVPLAEHDSALPDARQSHAVSIHVPLAEHDCYTVNPLIRPPSFNSRAPRGARHRALNSTNIPHNIRGN